jgi:uncharacterized protein (TIRG00374 family)
MTKARAPLTRRLLSVLRIVFALAILVWVAGKVPWTDELTHVGPGAESVVAGRIEGDWKRDQIAFVPREPTALDASWPEDARAAAAKGAPIVAVRRPEGAESGYDWHPGMPRAFRDMDLRGLALAEGLFLVAVLTIVTRWWRLLALAGCPTSWWNALRLTFLGLFFNNVLPGATGGDLVKGVIVAKENKGRGAEALVTVLVDRIFGMLALALLALAVILAAPSAAFEPLRNYLLIGLAVCALGVALYANKALRRAVGLSRLVDRLAIGPKLRSLDRAALSYLRQPGAVAIAFLFSFFNHILMTLGVFALGNALGVHDVSLIEYFVVVPLANLVSAVPLAPGGWGVGELAFAKLFDIVGASDAMGVAVSITFRLSQLAIGLLGGIFMLLPGSRDELREARQDPPEDTP